MVKGIRKAAMLAVAAGILAMGFVGTFSVPAHAVTDPTYDLDCSTAPSDGVSADYNLIEAGSPPAATCTTFFTTSPCPASTSCQTYSGKAVTAYTDGATSNGVIYVSIAGTFSGGYSLSDCGTNTACPTYTIIASGSWSGTTTVSGCSAQNSILFSGSGDSGFSVKTGDLLVFTITKPTADSTLDFCSGSTTMGALTPSEVSTVAGVPQFALGTALVVGFGLAGLLAMKKRAALPPQTH